MAPLFGNRRTYHEKTDVGAALACTLLAGCGPVRTEPVEQETPGPVRR